MASVIAGTGRSRFAETLRRALVARHSRLQASDWIDRRAVPSAAPSRSSATVTVRALAQHRELDDLGQQERHGHGYVLVDVIRLDVERIIMLEPKPERRSQVRSQLRDERAQRNAAMFSSSA
jgi:hypothetical protein